MLTFLEVGFVESVGRKVTDFKKRLEFQTGPPLGRGRGGSRGIWGGQFRDIFLGGPVNKITLYVMYSGIHSKAKNVGRLHTLSTGLLLTHPCARTIGGAISDADARLERWSQPSKNTPRSLV